jgi:hypothetical protein
MRENMWLNCWNLDKSTHAGVNADERYLNDMRRKIDGYNTLWIYWDADIYRFAIPLWGTGRRKHAELVKALIRANEAKWEYRIMTSERGLPFPKGHTGVIFHTENFIKRKQAEMLATVIGGD